MTLKQHKARFADGMKLRCVDHWIPTRVGSTMTITRAGSTVCDAEMDGEPYRSEHPKASELVRCDERGYRVETAKPNGTPMWWEWEIVTS